MNKLRGVSDTILRLLIGIFVLLFVWQFTIFAFHLPTFVLPSPSAVMIKITTRSSILIHHSWVTLQEMLIGLMLGLLIGFLLALLMLWFAWLKRWLHPMIIISQAIPVFAIAPLLMLWLGYGIPSKVVMASIIIFFPLSSCCFDGISSTPKEYLELCQSIGATRWQQLVYVRLPAALPAIASGIRISVVVAPIGAISGEWIGSSAGLGYLMLQANAHMAVDEMFAALICLSCLSVTLYGLIDLLLKKLIYWNVS